MARPARRNGMKWEHMYKRYIPGAKFKRRKGSCRCCAPRPLRYARKAAQRAAIEEQMD